MANPWSGATIQIIEIMMMTRKSLRRFVLPILSVGLFLPQIGHADTIIALDAGYLRQNATTALNNTAGGGGLLLLVAAGGNGGTTFDNSLPADEYVAGGDFIVGAAGFNTAGGVGIGAAPTGGETLNLFTLPTDIYSSVSAGAYLELCWFPSITLAQYNSGVSPAAGTLFGAYNPNLVNPNQFLAPDGGNPWVLPGDGSTISLNFFTTDDSGTQPVADGYGTNFTVVPEPSTYAQLAGVFVGLMGFYAKSSRCRKAS